MTVPRLKKASTSSDVPSRKNSRSDANARDASDQINGIFGHVGSRTRSRSTSASAHTMKTALAQHLDEIAIKKERKAKKEVCATNMSRKEQKQPEESARVEEVPMSRKTQHDHDSSNADGSANSQGYADGMPAELCPMLQGTQDPVSEDDRGSAELTGSQLTF